ncbi:hypothetical protein KY284_027372 [Solanum tuberosum]|nr:hypothetical protein KY284_027372 [Solanum tuberosum]
MFNNQRLDLLQELRHQKAEQLVSHIRSQCESGSAVDIGRVTFATTLNLISNTIFLIDMVDSKFKKAHEFKELVWTIMEDVVVPNLSDFFPVLKWLDLQGVRRRIRPAYLRLHEIFEENIEKIVETRAAGMKKKGIFLDILLDQCEDDGSGFGTTIKPLMVASISFI